MMHKRRPDDDRSSPLPMKKRIRRKQRISFGRNTCRLFKSNVSDEERNRIWYKAEDYRRIQADIHADLSNAVSMHRKKYQWSEHRYAGHDNPAEEELCVRGLESLLSGPIHSKKARRRHFIEYFLHTHKHLKVTDVDELGALAISLSGNDQGRAQHMAEYDAYEAYKVHHESRLYFDQSQDLRAMEEFTEFDNVPKASIRERRRRSERSAVAPIA